MNNTIPTTYSTLIEKKQLLIKNLSTLTFGETDRKNYENMVFIAASLIGFLMGVMAIIWNSIVELPYIQSLISFFPTIVFFMLFYYSRFKKTYNTILSIFNDLCGLSVLYFANAGIIMIKIITCANNRDTPIPASCFLKQKVLHWQTIGNPNRWKLHSKII